MKLFSSILPEGKSEIRGDLIAGVTLATVAIPQAIGYASIAGMPLAAGLYTLILPAILFAIFASSRHLSIGADSSTAIILAGGLSTIAVVGSSEYISLALMVTLSVGLLLILAGILKLGFISDFLSNTVMVAFLTGIGILIMIKQIPGMLGISASDGSIIDLVQSLIINLDSTSFLSALIALVSLLIVFISRRISKKIPDMLIIVIGSILISMFFHLDLLVDTIGIVSGGLPQLTFVPIDSFSALPQMSLTIASLFLVAVAKSASLSRIYSSRAKDTFDENSDLISLGIANVGASMTGAFVSSGTSGRTEVTYYAGGKGQLTQIVMAAIVIIVILFFTGPLSHMPLAALSAIIFVIGLEMVDIKGIISIFKKSPGESVVAIASIIAVVLIGVEVGIVFAMVVSLLYHIKSGYRPKNTILILNNDRLRNVPVSIKEQTLPGLIIYRFNSSLYYANVPVFLSDIDLISKDIKWLCMDMSAVPSVDISAGDAIMETIETLESNGIKMVFSDVDPNVSRCFKRFGITQKVGTKSFYESPRDVMDAYLTSENAF